MNLSALKSFAPAVRLQLMEAITRKLDYVLTADTADLRAMQAQRDSLRRAADLDRPGLIERVAYLWFNRFAALRYLDAHGWHPFGARVLMGASADDTQPELLRVVRTGHLPTELASHTDPARLNRLLDGALPSPNPQAEVYRHLVLAACRYYHSLLPFLFEKLDDETELLLPDDLLTEHSVVHGFRTEIADTDCDDVEIIGWLYQFYISEKKDKVMARKSAVPKEDIPAVTQLFTPHWIVRYLVENSLGRLWLLNRPQSKLREKMPYYIEGEPEKDFLKIGRPEEIRLCDPACGSGHMLTYSFDLLYAIYEEEGYAPSDIPGLILRHNLHGIEICDRAAALAALALCMKARSRDNRFFRRVVPPQVMTLEDVRFEDGELGRYSRTLNLGDLFDQSLLKLLHQFEETRNFGSLIQPCLTEQELQHVRSAIVSRQSHLGSDADLLVGATHRKVLRVLEQAEALTQRYHVVVANPPYLGNKAQPDALRSFLKTHFEVGKHDLFSAFILRNRTYLLPGGISGMMTPFTWFFILTYSELRKTLLQETTFESAIVPEYHSFFESAFVPICAFVYRAAPPLPARLATFIDLEDYTGSDLQQTKALEAIRDPTCSFRYAVSPSELLKIPGHPFAYKLGRNFLNLVANGPYLSAFAEPREGINTGDNERFLRFWFEVTWSAICIGPNSCFDFRNASATIRWFPCNKGGPFRRWYGNNEYVVDWSNDGHDIRNFRDAEGTLLSRPQNTGYFFREGATWSGVGLTGFSARYFPAGFAFNSSGRSLFAAQELIPQLLAALNSNTSFELLKIVSPTLSFTVGNVASLPFKPLGREEQRTKVEQIVQGAVTVARADWDNFETSWDFRDQPLVRPNLKGATLEASWRNWEAHCIAAIRRMLELETENNRLFIAAYGLEGELQPEVPEDQITLARADVRKDVVAFLSYAVGCMMGRYSLDQPGLILADAGATLQDFLVKIPQPTFLPDQDGILPVLDGEWFEDDIVARTREFLRVTFGEATLNENLRFLEASLGKDLRRYFLTDFYKNHLSNERAYGYKKRPIYWLFRSPKGGFAALVYLHRMTRDTPNLVLNRYLRDYLKKLQARIEHLDHVQAVAATAKEKTAARKESDQLKKTLRECEEWERDVLLPLAQSRPELDLDDGVKVNYQKLGAALAPIPGLAAAEEE